MFDEFDFIVQDETAKSLSFNMTDDISLVDRAVLDELKRIGREKSETLRVSLHSTPMEELHNMVIYIDEKSPVNIHKHLQKEETYHIVEGRLAVVFFSPEGKIEKKIELSHEGCVMCRVPRNQYHTSLSVDEYAVFHESRVGPYSGSDSIVPDWSGSFSRRELVNEDVR